jgi:arginase
MATSAGLDVHIYDSPVIRQLNQQYVIHQNERSVFQANIELRAQVCRSLAENGKTLNIGGDHSMGFGTISAFLQTYPTESRVIWIDAHADLNTRAASPSGNHHGMPLSFMMGLDSDDAFPVPVRLEHGNLTYVGIRDLDPFEVETIDKLRINVITPGELEQCNADKMRHWVTEHVGTGKKVHISWDVDSTDPATEIGATGTPVKAGIRCAQVKDLIKIVAELNTLVSMDMTELNLDLAANDDERRQSMEKTQDVINHFLRCPL